MANRFWNMPSYQLEKQPVRLYAHITFGASGAPTLDTANSKGFSSVTRNSAGKFTLVLGQTASKLALDTYNRILSFHSFFDATNNSGTAPAAPLVYLIGNSVGTAGTASFQIETTNTSQSATDPANHEGLYLEIQLSNSNAP